MSILKQQEQEQEQDHQKEEEEHQRLKIIKTITAPEEAAQDPCPKEEQEEDLVSSLQGSSSSSSNKTQTHHQSNNEAPTLPAEEDDEDEGGRRRRRRKDEEGMMKRSTVTSSSSRACRDGRERLQRHRNEVAGKVWIPDIWGQEDLLKDWIDCSQFDACLVPNGVVSARAALVHQASTTPTSAPLRIDHSTDESTRQAGPPS